MVYRSTHHHAVTYHKGDLVLWKGTPHEVVQGGHKFGAITIRPDIGGHEIKFGPYDETWPEKVFA
jgi:hypothetical protein